MGRTGLIGQWEEIVLACDLVAQNGWRQLDASDPRVRELSGLLQRMSMHPLEDRLPSFRNAAGVARKTYNIATVHPDYVGSPVTATSWTRKALDEFIDDAARRTRLRRTVPQGRLRRGRSWDAGRIRATRVAPTTSGPRGGSRPAGSPGCRGGSRCSDTGGRGANCTAVARTRMYSQTCASLQSSSGLTLYRPWCGVPLHRPALRARAGRLLAPHAGDPRRVAGEARLKGSTLRTRQQARRPSRL